MMKRILFVACILLVSKFADAQVYVDGVNINADSRVQYIEIVHTTVPGIFEIISIDLGEKHKPSSRLTDKSGKRLVIESGIQLEQLFKNNGWTLVRRDMVVRSNSDPTFRGSTLVFWLWEKKG